MHATVCKSIFLVGQAQNGQNEEKGGFESNECTQNHKGGASSGNNRQP